MPEITRELTRVKPQRNGSVRVQEVLTSAKGHVIRHSYLAQSEAQAIIDMNARDVVGQFKEADFAELRAWVAARNTVASFDYVDREITERDGEEHVMIHFGRSVGSEAVKFAWWLESLNTGGPTGFNSIRDRVGFTGEQGADITSKFTFMVLVEPWNDLVVEV